MRRLWRQEVGHFNPRSPHGERHLATRFSLYSSDFNPRSPHGERPAPVYRDCKTMREFQSTLPARGATECTACSRRASDDFNPRSPHGERLSSFRACARLDLFQSTLPARGATKDGVAYSTPIFISIHAPRTGSDVTIFALFCRHINISIHAPRTGSDCGPPGRTTALRSDFNPRSPHGERHAECPEDFAALPISIHAPRTGSDFRDVRESGRRENFNPRSPHGERLGGKSGLISAGTISIHAPRTGSDTAIDNLLK